MGKRLFSGFLAIVTAISLFSSLGSCSKDEDPEVSVASVSMSQASLSLEVGATATLTATVSPSDATNKAISWTSSNSTVATVSNGVVTAVAEGSATITAMAGGKTATCLVTVTQEKPDAETTIKNALMKIYYAMNGPKWADNKGWGTDAPLEEWAHIGYNKNQGLYKIHFMYDKNVKGKIPEIIGELTTLEEFSIWDAPDLTGPLPDSFKNLVNLKRFELISTSVTSIPDIFGDMKKLESVQINANDKLSCPLPVSIGDSPNLNTLRLVSNRFTGNLPASWSRIGTELLVGDNCLSGVVPESILTIGESNVRWLIDDILYQKEGYGFDITNLELHGGRFWPDGPVDDLNGKHFSFDEVIAKNKYTVYLFWATWCPFSNVMMPQLKAYYAQYHDAGLEIIATIATGDSSGNIISLDDHRKAVKENGYGGWYNFYLWQKNPDYYPNRTPVAEVYDSDGTILFSSFSDLNDPVRNRFGQTTSSDLIPFLETLLGPADASEVYTSTDFSKDGEVLTLQKATVGKGINIVFLGDAYTDKDMNEGGLYETVMKESMEEFFAIEPYKTFRNRFNVYAVKAVSTNDHIGDGYSTALSCYYGNGTTVLGSDDACYAYALKVPGITNQENLLICAMVNSTISKGTTSMSYMRKSSVAYTTTIGNYAELFGDVLRHEAGGHGFAFLADEYSNVYDYAPADHIKHYTDMFEQYDWFSNVDFTSDRDKIRWSAFLKDDRYADQVGIYEGGALYSKGVWRPSKNSIMNENMGGFNAPSRWAIYQRIMKLSGEECTFEKFLKYDAVNRDASTDATKMSMKGAANRRVEHSAPPVIVP